MITAFYSFRLISLTFFTYPNAPKSDYETSHEQPFIVVVPYVILSLLAIFFGYVAKEAFVSPGSDMLSASLFVHPSHITLIEAEFGLPLFYKLLPALGSFTGAAIALILYNQLPQINPLSVDLTISFTQTKLGSRIYSFLNGKYLFDVIYNYYIIGKTLGLGLITSKYLDRGLIEKMGPFGLTDSLHSTSRQIATVDTGVVTSYALYIILGFISITFLIFIPGLSDASQISSYNDGSFSGIVDIGDLRLILLLPFLILSSTFSAIKAKKRD